MQPVLFVDDDENLLSGFKRTFRKKYKVDTATSGQQALKLLSDGNRYAVVVSDMRMPGMSGVELLSQISRNWPDPVRIMLTGNSDQETAVDAVNEGNVWQFVNKPCANEDMIATIDAALEHYHFRKMEKALLEQTLGGSVKLMVDMLQLACPGHFERSRLLRDPALYIAEKTGLPNLWEIRLVALLSNIGLVSFPDVLLEKLATGTSLDAETQAVFDTHPVIAARLIEGIPRLEGVAAIIRHQLPGQPPVEEQPPAAALFQLLNALLPPGSTTWPARPDIETALKTCGHIPDDIVAATREWFDATETEKRRQQREHLSLPLARLLPGDRLEADLKTREDVLLLRLGHELTRDHIDKIRQQVRFVPLQEPVAISRVTLTPKTKD